jgi:hypothetical protein
MHVFTEAPRYVTRMVRCRYCGVAFASSDQQVAAPTQSDYIETCPAGHRDHYVHADYYFV